MIDLGMRVGGMPLKKIGGINNWNMNIPSEECVAKINRDKLSTPKEHLLSEPSGNLLWGTAIMCPATLFFRGNIWLQ
jgi:hypothetical protein